LPREQIVRVGVFAHNEEGLLGTCVRAILGAGLPPGHVLREVTVVSCASTDRTDELARELGREDARVALVANPERRGKANAINGFLEGNAADLYVIISADVVIHSRALIELLKPFADPTVGMTGVHPVPRNDDRGLGAVVHVLWELHDRVAREQPKLGEAVAVRAPAGSLPLWTRADEVSLESSVVRRGLRLVYCPDAIAWNRGPSTLRDYVELRTRVAGAHLEIERHGYQPPTRDLKRVVRHALGYWVEHPSRGPALLAAAAIEGLCWLNGRRRARKDLSQATDGTWQPLASARAARGSTGK
jgi:cellulose synthase/poly-beta-1,6-N-acetylglucosamine synthase-like glycosyltransferase